MDQAKDPFMPAAKKDIESCKRDDKGPPTQCSAILPSSRARHVLVGLTGAVRKPEAGYTQHDDGPFLPTA